MKNIWKIMLALVLVLCISFTLIACGGEDDGTQGGTQGNGGTTDNGDGTTPGNGGGTTDPGNDTTGTDGNLADGGAETTPGFGAVTPAN